ncbi:TadE/TadG family type IV pilus assembly protein [Methylobacterium sp. B4]|uniref:TadE/TadG family type IV pilus assembly protein n=1 Tax=Methylobacterium sp. B4 TaxID=1938755 RepID=UPI000D7532D0|nr:TadE/TadG family type IV pilus assembly protein [Methylobacterium sp. B4]PXW65515.1 TadE-like protein [Methylobacterium sp. B4]
MRCTSKYIRDERGATTVEFALVGLAFIATMLFVMGVAAVLYLNQVLDNATARATRQIMTGKAQSQSTPMTAAAFRQSLCANLPAALSCSDVIINLYVVPKGVQPGGYYAFVNADRSGLALPKIEAASGQFKLGGRGEYQYLQVIYPITFLPSIVASWMSSGTTYNGKPAFLAVSGAAFRNERY